ncbi:hypothetical protein CDD81_6319 [Ophiocordyceps australis]|uniref:Uncharacterized protein n=1 Tax=Ophiocordyceps australis TaxID=1399860 RepID=A0A2C5Y7Y9_9HYPO|nr:hypothetical protein CDD81_6319 [Ophiocordyceps australis]
MRVFILLALVGLAVSNSIPRYGVLPGQGPYLDTHDAFPETKNLLEARQIIPTKPKKGLESGKQTRGNSTSATWWNWAKRVRSRSNQLHVAAWTIEEMKRTDPSLEASVSDCINLFSLKEAIQGEPPRPRPGWDRTILSVALKRANHAMHLFGNQCPVLIKSGRLPLKSNTPGSFDDLKKRKQSWHKWQSRVKIMTQNLNHTRVEISAKMEKDAQYIPTKAECTTLFSLMDARISEPIRPNGLGGAEFMLGLDTNLVEAISLFGRQCAESKKTRPA